MRLLFVLALAGGAILAGVGFAGSYSAQHALAERHGFGWFAPVFPVGVDAGIVVLLAADLALAARRAAWPVLRTIAHVFTLATIAFNAAAGQAPISADPIGAGMHAIIPVMFIASVEAARRAIIRQVRLEDGMAGAGVPLSSWVLSPWRTWRTWRRQKIWGLKTYVQAIALEQEREVYGVMLEREYGRNWRKEAPVDALLPITMAPYGLSVDQALALPQAQQEREGKRREDQAEREVADQLAADQRAADTSIARLHTAARVEAARHQVNAQTSAAAVEAGRVARAAQEEAEALESVVVATARLEAAQKAEDAEAAERRVIETRAAAAEMVRREAAARAEIERAQAAAEADRRRAAEDAERAVEADRRATETRVVVAEMELRAVEAEDMARLTTRDRNRRKVARMIAFAGGVPELVELQTIVTEVGVSTTTASELRREAAEMLAQGYHPDPSRSRV